MQWLAHLHSAHTTAFIIYDKYEISASWNVRERLKSQLTIFYNIVLL